MDEKVYEIVDIFVIDIFTMPSMLLNSDMDNKGRIFFSMCTQNDHNV